MKYFASRLFPNTNINIVMFVILWKVLFKTMLYFSLLSLFIIASYNPQLHSEIIFLHPEGQSPWLFTAPPPHNWVSGTKKCDPELQRVSFALHLSSRIKESRSPKRHTPLGGIWLTQLEEHATLYPTLYSRPTLGVEIP